MYIFIPVTSIFLQFMQFKSTSFNNEMMVSIDPNVYIYCHERLRAAIKDTLSRVTGKSLSSFDTLADKYNTTEGQGDYREKSTPNLSKHQISRTV